MNHIRQPLPDRVRAIIAEVLNTTPADLRDAETIVQNGGDNLDLVEVACELEEAFGVELEVEAIGAPATVADLVRMMSGGRNG